ncbi:MAG: hypothetical protein ACYDD6_04555, partial [Acidimicrobiales bacterium]
MDQAGEVEPATVASCLGAGAGLVGRELRALRGSDVVRRSGGVLVCVRDRNPRVVPVRKAFHDRLLVAARAAGTRPRR